MKIFGICLVKNEEDILRESLAKALQWCDEIFIYDTGSDDETWSIAEELTLTFPTRITCFARAKRPFRDDLRSEVFNKYRHRATLGDWWCRLDADEIYIDDPREFLRTIPAIYKVVHSLSVQYYFTEKDELAWANDKERMQQTDAESRARYYLCNHSEARFFRHRDRLKWTAGSWPAHMGLVAPARIRVKHLQYRSPDQIQKRLDTRRQAILDGYTPFAAYDNVRSWRDKIVSSEALHYDDGRGCYLIDENDLPRHLEAPSIRVAKSLLHTVKIWP